MKNVMLDQVAFLIACYSLTPRFCISRKVRRGAKKQSECFQLCFINITSRKSLRFRIFNEIQLRHFIPACRQAGFSSHIPPLCSSAHFARNETQNKNLNEQLLVYSDVSVIFASLLINQTCN